MSSESARELAPFNHRGSDPEVLLLNSAALLVGQEGGILNNAIMSSATFESLADKQVLHLTTIGRVTGRPHEIEIWFIVYHKKFYLFPNIAKPPVGSRTSGATRTSASGSGSAE